jgi:LDH2 family malate/lactate/ureidoglycolate dehydrogenase
MAEVCVTADRMLTLARGVLRALNVPEADALLVADTLVQADLWGHQSHGVMRLPWYAARIVSGAMTASVSPSLLVDSGAIGLLDGRDGIGQVVMAAAAREAIARAKTHGISAIGVRNSNHFGTAMYFTRLAAQEGCIAILSTNASPAMAPWGGRAKIVGTNPWSIAAPAGPHPPMVLDIANTAVARGKIYLAQKQGESIPAGWAITRDGAPATDPAEAIAGILLPMAGHKGYAIAVMMDVLSGLLTGSAFGPSVNGPYQADKTSGCGHFMIALNVAAFQPLAEFDGRMEELIRGLKAVPLAQGFDDVFYPGEIEARNDVRQRRDGVWMPDDTAGELDRLAQTYGVAVRLCEGASR